MKDKRPPIPLLLAFAFVLGAGLIQLFHTLLDSASSPPPAAQSPQAPSPEEAQRAQREAILGGYVAASHSGHSQNEWDFPVSNEVVAADAVAQESALPTLRLRVDPADLQLMQEAIVHGHPRLGHDPGGNKPFRPAVFTDENGSSFEAEICLRGLMPWHHHAEKPSLRVKIPSSIARGQRYVELSRPKDLLAVRNWMPDRLGEALGLMTSKSDHVRLIINDTYRGVYLRSRRPNDALAVAGGRLPGAFFKDAGPPAAFWRMAAFWNQSGSVTEVSVRALNALLRSMGSGRSEQSLRQMLSFVDRDAFARWSALTVLVGSTHQDHLHNHVLHFPLNRGTFEPLPWDVMGYSPGAPTALPPTLLGNPFIAWLLRDPRWVYERDLRLHELLLGAGSAEAQIAAIGEELARIEPDLRADVYRGGCEPRIGLACVLNDVDAIPVEQDRINTWIRARNAMLLAYLEGARAEVVAHPQKPGYSQVTVFGTAAVRVVGAAAEGEGKILYPGLSAYPVPATMLSPYQTRVTRPALSPAPIRYEVAADAGSLQLVNAITGGPVEIGTAPEQVELVSVVAVAQPPQRSPRVVTLGPGEVALDETLVVDAADRLVMAPGTTLRLAPGVSIISYGRLTAQGTQESPIEIRGAGPEPWGALAIVGPQSAGSRLQHVRVEGGSVTEHSNVQFKGMVNAYGTADLIIENSEFLSNHRGDDAVNIATSTFTIRRSKWADARADALDIDQGSGSIEDCVFERSGNDALDLMTSQIAVHAVRTSESGDKGMSVGERSRVTVTGSTFAKGAIGVEVKDDSEVTMSDSILRANEIGWHAYRKKWIYSSAGRGQARALTFENNRLADVDLEDGATLTLEKSTRPTVLRGIRRLTIQ